MAWVKYGIKPICRVYRTGEKIDIQPFFNRNMNLRKKYKVNIYDKNIHDKWILDEQVEGDTNYLLIGKQLYFLQDLDILMPLNMDFNSPDCHRCYEVVARKARKAKSERRTK